MKVITRLSLLVLAVSFAACGPKHDKHSDDDGHGHKEEGHDHSEGAEGARFSEGKGIALQNETKEAIGLKVAEVEERKLTPIVSVEAQVYRAAAEPSLEGGEQSGSAYASALLPSDVAQALKEGDRGTLNSGEVEYAATVWKIDPSSKEAVNSEEVIVRIDDAGKTLRVGDFVSGSLTESRAANSVVSVPRSAVLETATGKFAYVENGDFLLRTPVTTGFESSEYVEITDGVYAGDVVAIQPVETLYLIELRATKGGGHSH